MLADSWKEFFYCDAIDKSTLVVKGQKRTTSRTVNTKGNDNIISSGSVIAVADGQCMIIVEQGRVVEVSAEPGEFIFDSSTEPSIFAGNLGTQIINSFKTVGRRIAFGGDTGKDQRVYYFNTKEIPENMFGTSSPIPAFIRSQSSSVCAGMSLGRICSLEISANAGASALTNSVFNCLSICERVYASSTLPQTFV